MYISRNQEIFEKREHYLLTSTHVNKIKVATIRKDIEKLLTLDIESCIQEYRQLNNNS